jgi:hypothetical protein
MKRKTNMDYHELLLHIRRDTERYNEKFGKDGLEIK